MPRREASLPSTLRRRQRRDVALLKAHAGATIDELAGRDNVAYVTVGEKRVGGAGIGQAALVVYVTKKGGMDDANRVPESVTFDLPDGRQLRVPTDVVELPGPPRLLGIRAGNRIRAPDRDFGTCGLCFTRGADGYLITNSHVVSNLSTGTFPGEPSVQDPTTLQMYVIGETIYMTPINANMPTDEDYAIIRANPPLQVDPLGVAGENLPVASVSSFAGRPTAQYWYSVNGAKVRCRNPEWVPRALIEVDHGRFEYRDFWQLQITQGAVAAGHSGALVCTGTGANIIACGLLFGGVPPNYLFAFPMDDVFQRASEELNSRGY